MSKQGALLTNSKYRPSMLKLVTEMLCDRGGQKLSPYLCAHVSSFHTSKNFAEEERNGDLRVSLLLSSSMGFARVGCKQLELLFVVVVLTGVEEKRERGSSVGAVSRAASGRCGLRL
ncbi:uncharacterized protein [Solanum lycopersicum]|uniref:uncharacterized protein n=1 Tax=Solanum lycopersicum TaxID=4081 RepID=UPI000532C88E|nr:uncharacterized protein LOC104647013 [Solanum lycopersicum]